MAKPELGTKRQCLSCGSKFYDLSRDPILCPKCGTLFQVAIPRVSASPVGEEDEGGMLGETDAVELVSLDDMAAREVDSDSDDDIDLGDDLPDDEETFLADDDEENDDVSALIDGDIETDDEN